MTATTASTGAWAPLFNESEDAISLFETALVELEDELAVESNTVAKSLADSM